MQSTATSITGRRAVHSSGWARVLGVILLGSVCVFGAKPVRAQASSVGGQQRFALVVGNNLGDKPGRALRYAEEEVARVAEILRVSGDFTHVELLRGESRATLEGALIALRERMLQARANNQSTLFLFYYSGHGDNDALELGQTRFLLRELRAYLEALPADVRLAFVDACHSGALTGVKGGRRAPSYQLRLADPGSVRGLAIVTSSTANELSQESDELRGSFFSHHVMSGLRGAADASRDGQVTLSELYQYAFQRTLAHTAANLNGGQHPTYETRMAGTGDVILTRTRPSDAQITFPRESGPTYTIFDGHTIVAEIAPSMAHDVYLALPAGRYRVVRRELGDVREQEVRLLAGESRALQPSQMLAFKQDPAGQRKKGWTDGDGERADETLFVTEMTTSGRAPELGKGADLTGQNLLGVHAGLGAGTIENTSLQGLIGLSYLRGLSDLSLRARLGVSSFTGRLSNDVSTSFVRVAPAIDILFTAATFRRVGLLVGASAGVPYIRQQLRFPDASWRDSMGVTAGGVASLFMHIGHHGAIWLDGALGVEAHKLDGRVQARGSGSLTLGGTLGF